MITATHYGPWAVIIGGSEGLGASFAYRLANAGLNLLIVARKPGPLQEVTDQVRAESGVEVRTLSLDLAREDMLDRIREASDDIEVGLLVYNAGAAHRTGGFLDMPLDDAMRTLRVNSIGQMSLSHHFGRKMVERGRGGIIIIGAISCIAGSPGIVTYCAVKAFSQIFAEGLWLEVRSHGVDVLQVPVSLLNTPAMARLGIHHGPERNPIDPDLQAAEILDNIKNGPVFVPPQLAETFRQYGAKSRREAVEMRAGQIRGIPGIAARPA